jgi:hypothetical protein
MAKTPLTFLLSPLELCHRGQKARREQTKGFQNFRMRSVLEKNGLVSMVLEIECFHGIGAFEVHLSKVSALPSPKRLPAAKSFGRRGYAQAGLKLSHPPLRSIFRVFWFFSDYNTVSLEKP